jgi:hypothetical protein
MSQFVDLCLTDMEMGLCVDGGFLLLRVVSCFEIGVAEVCVKEREKVWMQILSEC